MTSERFSDELDRLDSGLPEHPDTAAYKREGRAVRRRRQGIVALGAGALVAAAVAPAVLWGGGTATSGPPGDVASDPSAVASSDPAPAPLVPVDASYGDGVRAAVAEAFPDASFVEQSFGDHYEDVQGGRRPVASTPTDWANVFTWSQDYAIDGLQYFDTTAYWASVPTADMQWCSSASFEIEKDCTATQSGGYTIVVHDGVRLRGEPDGDWTRSIQVVSPRSERGRSQYTEVWAQVEAMSWAEADAALPTAAELTALAVDERLRLPEPAEVPSSF